MASDRIDRYPLAERGCEIIEIRPRPEQVAGLDPVKRGGKCVAPPPAVGCRRTPAHLCLVHSLLRSRCLQQWGSVAVCGIGFPVELQFFIAVAGQRLVSSSGRAGSPQNSFICSGGTYALVSFCPRQWTDSPVMGHQEDVKVSAHGCYRWHLLPLPRGSALPWCP